MSDPRATHWLADDANFLATLGDLDRGLGDSGNAADAILPNDAQQAATAARSTAPLPPRSAPVSPGSAASRTSARVIDAARALSAAAPPSSSAAPAESRPRPLLDLFPEWALMPESPQSSAPAAPGPVDDAPRLPRSPVVTVRPEPAAPPQPQALTDDSGYGTEVIDGALIEAAAGDLDLQPPADGPGLLGRLLIVAVFALLVLVGAAGALWASRDAVERTILQWEQMPLPPGGPVRQLSVPLAPIPPPEVIPDNLQRRPAI